MKSFKSLQVYVDQILSDITSPRSVCFFTLHKCASTLFGNYILKNVKGLESVDYASKIYSGEISFKEEIIFKKRGYVYGPIRISDGETSPVGRMLVKPTINYNFIRNKRTLFLVRDPRDILISSYYSFGFTHDLSTVDEIRKTQEDIRKEISEKTLDKYVLDEAEKQVFYFKALYEVRKNCQDSILLKYEEMIEDFDAFVDKFLKYLPLEESIIQAVYDKSRPRDTEDLASHHRSGSVQGFRHKLKESTIQSLNAKLEDILVLFEYEI